ncbi:rRNA methyltransferase 3A, mitochondrial [Nematolebias whitei]|uniref:rRNA methyltransferase 3A, mitochondrial n=1 Tax=Nematolebias whitei TaxID=451745 RepID=UPI001899BA19|nr:rRNA methyltransferase 3A, mitochondrial [Nematolebias whitei]
MAAFMRGVKCLVSTERNVLLIKRSGIFIESKRYVRGLKRKPVNVLFPENEPGKVVKPPSETRVKKPAEKQNATRITSKTTEYFEKDDSVKTSSPDQSTVRRPQVSAAKSQLDGLHIESAFPGDKRLSRLVSVARSRTFRERQGKILLEGRRLICDALEAGASPQTVFFSTLDRLQELPLDKLRRATLIKVKFDSIKTWSELVAPQGVIAIFSRPDPTHINYPQRDESVPLCLICDNIRDPGNLGTMLRSAAAAGCSKVLLTKGCVDAWEPKVLRAAMGAHFRFPIYPHLDWDDVEDHLPKSVIVHVADSGPIIRTDTEENVSCKAGDYNWVSSRPNKKKVQYEDYDTDSDSDSDSDSESEDEDLSLPSVETKLYHESWAQGSTALVIGGETHGLSHKAVQLAEKTDGRRLFIPVVHSVDSLNSAMAASILVFEGRRQLLQLLQTSGKKPRSKAERLLS